MSEHGENQSRRNFLIGTTTVIGAVGVAGAAVPFLRSWSPSAKAKAAGAPVKANIGKIQEGQMITVEWRGKPIYILRRPADVLASLNNELREKLADPDSKEQQQPAYVSGNARSITGHDDILVVVGICTHLGCTPKFRPDVGAQDLSETNDAWLGGFFCPCHGSKFDLSGRVHKSVPAPTNLEVPPYRYISNDVIVIGEDQETI